MRDRQPSQRHSPNARHDVELGDDIGKTHSIETFQWDENGDLTIKTYYDMPEGLGEDDDPYELILGKENVIPND